MESDCERENQCTDHTSDAMAALDETQQGVSFADTLALSSLFSNCIESIGLIVPFHETRYSENLLVSKVAIQQNRLLCWGEILGISSPPASTGITQAIPKHAGSTNPDPNQPINFSIRDPRLDDPELRIKINDALHGILDPIFSPDNADLRKTYGLKHYKAGRFAEQPFSNILRLEAFREKVALLEDVTHNFELPDLPRKKSRTLMPRWYIEDEALFSTYLEIIRQNTDYLIKLLDNQPQVDKAMAMDLRGMGWHPSDAQVDISRMAWKLGIIKEATEQLQYPEYTAAAKEALDNVFGVWKGLQSYQETSEHNPQIQETCLHTVEEAAARLQAVKLEKEAKSGIFGFKPKFLRKRTGKGGEDRRKSFDGSALTARPDAKRSSSTFVSSDNKASVEGLDPPRSQSVHAMTSKEYERAQPTNEFNGLVELGKVPTSESAISRHDMYKGIGRLETRQ